MEFFPDGLVVRLRSRSRGALYLYARDDGIGVAVSPRRSSRNTGWEVRRFQREGTDCFVLRSSATGRCLAAAESAADQRRRRAAAVQRDHVVGLRFHRATTWRATWAGLQHGDVILRSFFFSRRLCAEADARYGNAVFVELENRGENRRTGTAASHWFVEAALPLPLSLHPVPRPPSTDHTCLCVPRLNLYTAAGARLPILSTENVFLGYLPARSITGLVRLLLDGTGGGEMLQADAAAVGGEARNGQLVTALAFVPGRGKGITTLPLHLQDQKDAGAVLDGDDHGEPSANDDIEPQPAGVVVVGADDLVPEEEQDAEAAALEDQQAQEEEPQQLLVAQPGVQANADGDALGGQAQGDGQQAAVDHHAQFLQQQIADTLKYLSETYEVMEKKHHSIRLLIEQKRVTAQEAAARRDWSDVDKLHRALHKNIVQDIALYDTKAREASAFRESLVRLGVPRPPSPPPLLRTHPAHQLTRRRG